MFEKPIPSKSVLVAREVLDKLKMSIGKHELVDRAEALQKAVIGKKPDAKNS